MPGQSRRGAVTAVPASRRGVELSMNLIIIIVVGLIILAILVYLLVRNTGNAQASLSGCREKGGTCKDTCDPGESGSSFFRDKTCSEGEICCIPQDRLIAQS